MALNCLFGGNKPGGAGGSECRPLEPDGAEGPKKAENMPSMSEAPTVEVETWGDLAVKAPTRGPANAMQAQIEAVLGGANFASFDSSPGVGGPPAGPAGPPCGPAGPARQPSRNGERKSTEHRPTDVQPLREAPEMRNAGPSSKKPNVEQALAPSPKVVGPAKGPVGPAKGPVGPCKRPIEPPTTVAPAGAAANKESSSSEGCASSDHEGGAPTGGINKTDKVRRYLEKMRGSGSVEVTGKKEKKEKKAKKQKHMVMGPPETEKQQKEKKKKLKNEKKLEKARKKEREKEKALIAAERETKRIFGRSALVVSSSSSESHSPVPERPEV